MTTLEKVLTKNYNLPPVMVSCISKILEEYKKAPIEVPNIITLKKYSEKAGIVTGLDYRKDKKLATLIKGLGLLKWNATIGGFIYSFSRHEDLVEFLDGQKLDYSDLTTG